MLGSKSTHLKGDWEPVLVTWRFCIKGGQLGRRDVFAPNEANWDPLWVTWRFCTKGGQLGRCVGDMAFLHQRRSIGTPCLWRVHLSVCLFVTFYPHHQFSIGLRLSVCNDLSSPLIAIEWVCLFVTFHPHHQFNQAERHRREVRRWEHPKTVFLPKDPF